jgi:hypothetical protein
VAGTVCRAAVGPCDVAETCSGGATICPANAFEADGTSCADGATCNGAEVCASGVCQSGVPVDCDDADACTMDACVEPGGTCTLTPVSGCCMTDTDCDDGDACTLDVCESTTTNMCAFMMMPGCPDAGAGDGGTGDGGAEDGGVGDGGVGDGGVGDGGVGDGGRADAGDGGDAEAGDGGLAGDASEADAMPVDTGTDPGDDGGCGCRAAPRSSAPSFWLLGFVALSWARRRRRGIRRRSNPPKPSVG